MIEPGSELPGRPLSRGDPFPFRCHPGLSCFNSCCRDKRLMLLPYDVLRLARGLGVATGAFLEEHAELETDPGSGWPALRIRLAADGRCPFVGEAGCTVYRDRPACCRVYPLARAVRLDAAGEPGELVMVAEEGGGCQGFAAPAGRTVAEWMREQGLDAYRAANDRVARLFLHPRRPRPLSLPPSEVHAVVMALYNLDVFREFVARPGFAGRSGLPPERVDRALASDEALLELGQDWLAARLFG
ncbi:MAG TPA: YkgJ family cysteine cluster protein [Anaeromyxobacteraceae bacterium]|nr:YkgJ family cysteine cluster protein [Anaeromyxobacteraceae bacterium]